MEKNLQEEVTSQLVNRANRIGSISSELTKRPILQTSPNIAEMKRTEKYGKVLESSWWNVFTKNSLAKFHPQHEETERESGLSKVANICLSSNVWVQNLYYYKVLQREQGLISVSFSLKFLKNCFGHWSSRGLRTQYPTDPTVELPLHSVSELPFTHRTHKLWANAGAHPSNSVTARRRVHCASQIN